MGQDVAIGERTFSEAHHRGPRSQHHGSHRVRRPQRRRLRRGPHPRGRGRGPHPAAGRPAATRPVPSSIGHRLTMLFTRLRSNQAEPVRTDEENAIRRVVDLPDGPLVRSTAARPASRRAPPGRGGRRAARPARRSSEGGVTARSDVRLPGSLTQRASAAIDGDPTTAWTSIYQNQVGHYIEYDVRRAAHLRPPRPARSSPTAATRCRPSSASTSTASGSAPSTSRRSRTCPTSTGASRRTAPSPSRCHLPEAVTGTDLPLHGRGRARRSPPATGTQRHDHRPGGDRRARHRRAARRSARATPSTAGAPTGSSRSTAGPCRSGSPGSTADALARRALAATACGPDADGVDLEAGEHIFRTAPGVDDQRHRPRPPGVRLRAGWRGRSPLAQLPTEVPPGPTVTVDAQLAVETRGTLAGDRPAVLAGHGPVVEQRVERPGRRRRPRRTHADRRLRQRLVRRPRGGRHRRRRLRPSPGSPSQSVWIAIGISAVAMVVCLVLMVARRAQAPDHSAPSPPTRPAGRTRARPPVAVARPPRRGPAPASVVVAGVSPPPSPWPWPSTSPNQRPYPLWRWPSARPSSSPCATPRWRSWFGLAAAGATPWPARSWCCSRSATSYPSDFTWPAHFDQVHILALVAITPPPGRRGGGPGPSPAPHRPARTRTRWRPRPRRPEPDPSREHRPPAAHRPWGTDQRPGRLSWAGRRRSGRSRGLPAHGGPARSATKEMS